MDPAYYYLSEVEELFRLSRDSLIRWAKAGIFDLQGTNRGRRATGASVRAAYARQEAGEDLWQAVKESESRARSAAKPTAKVRSTKTEKESGGSSPRPKVDAESLADAPLVSKPQSWLKRII